MAEQNNQAERAKFEAALTGRWNLELRVDDEGDTVYVDDDTQLAFLGWNLACRAALPAAVDAVDLPPLPCMSSLGWNAATANVMGFTQDDMQAYARQAIEADRRRQVITQPASIDTPAFRALLRDYRNSTIDAGRTAELIAYIDGRTDGAAPSGNWYAQQFLNWNRAQAKPPVAIGKELGVALKVMEFAAPSHQSPGKE